MVKTTVQKTLRAAHNIRRDNLLNMVGWGKRFATFNALAAKLEVVPSYLPQLLGAHAKRRISEVTARKFEHKLGLPAGTLDKE